MLTDAKARSDGKGLRQWAAALPASNITSRRRPPEIAKELLMSKSDQQSNNTTNRQVHFISGTQ